MGVACPCAGEEEHGKKNFNCMFSSQPPLLFAVAVSLEFRVKVIAPVSIAEGHVPITVFFKQFVWCITAILLAEGYYEGKEKTLSIFDQSAFIGAQSLPFRWLMW